ncbi:MAG: DNA mismatch repair protein MutT [Chloroflexi bacterium]|nr:DNA mismatch repair protein MutT [Chloroflexota bacterium]MQG05459.1 NUDIX domain-containing protein [SAR202 cluster bacterium]
MSEKKYTKRHFTATGFLVNDVCVLLHWHEKVKAWLPLGGHIEENEDPVTAVLREIREESGIVANVFDSGSNFEFDNPLQITPPFTILIEDINDPIEGYHQHIDMIYICILDKSHNEKSEILPTGCLWVDIDSLRKKKPFLTPDGQLISPPDDVAIIASHAIKVVNGY